MSKFINYRIKQRDKTQDKVVQLLLRYNKEVRQIVAKYEKGYGRVYSLEDVYGDIYIELQKKQRSVLNMFFEDVNYFCKSIHNFCKDILKDEKKRQLPELYSRLRRKNTDWLQEQEDTVKRIDDRIEWEYHISKLSPKEKDVFILHANGYKHEEIAKELNISLSSSKQRNKRAKDKIIGLRA